jgi:hypothetical protein
MSGNNNKPEAKSFKTTIKASITLQVAKKSFEYDMNLSSMIF